SPAAKRAFPTPATPTSPSKPSATARFSPVPTAAGGSPATASSPATHPSSVSIRSISPTTDRSSRANPPTHHRVYPRRQTHIWNRQSGSPSLRLFEKPIGGAQLKVSGSGSGELAQRRRGGN